MWPSCPIRMDKTQQQIAHEQTREMYYLSEWLHSWTHTIWTFESKKNEIQVIQETTCYESLTKKCICNKKFQIAKFLHEAACFRFKSYVGPRLLNGPLMQNSEKNLPYLWLVYVLGKTWVLTPFFPWSVWWLFWNVGSFAKPMFFFSLEKSLGKGDQCSLSSARRITKILHIALNT